MFLEGKGKCKCIYYFKFILNFKRNLGTVRSNYKKVCASLLVLNFVFNLSLKKNYVKALKALYV